MSDERGDSRFSSFLVGFLIGSLLAGGGVTGYFLVRDQSRTEEARVEAVMAADRAAELRNMALMLQRRAEVERERVEEAMKKLKEE